MRLTDSLARLCIVVGGIGTIVAVSLVCVFLAVVALKLFTPSTITHDGAAAAPWRGDALHIGIDENRVLGWALTTDGSLVHYCASGDRLGQLLGIDSPLGQRKITASSLGLNGRNLTLALDDGSLQTARVELTTRYLSTEQAEQTFPAAKLDQLGIGQWAEVDRGMVQRISPAQFRTQRFQLVLDAPLDAPKDSPIVLLDHSTKPNGTVVCTLSSDDKLRILEGREQRSMLTGQTTLRTRTADIPYQGHRDGVAPKHVLLSGVADTVLVLWEDGHCMRFDVRDLANPILAEELDLVPENGETLTAVAWMVGKVTLLTGDSLGRVRGWFGIRPDDAKTRDGVRLVPAHELTTAGAAVSCVTASGRSRVAAASFADGTTRLFYVTSNTPLVEDRGAALAPAERMVVAPGDKSLLAVTADGLSRWNLGLEHPEASFRSLFLPVWYEGATHPANVWQSSSGSDEFEPKFGLMPLIFGTLKATFYSLMFGVPLAILAAIYTSEFLSRRVRGWIKPSIELMASLPSVVLGFLAAIVLAPFIETVLTPVLMMLFCVPVAFLFCAYVWQMLPHNARLKLAPWRFVLIALVALPLGPLAAWAIAPMAERLFFGGDIMAYLDGQVGSAVGGWMFMWLPLSAVAVAYGITSQVNPRLRNRGMHWTRQQWAVVDFVKFVGACGATLLLAIGVSACLNWLGADPRGTYIDTYVQRNSLVVGFMMGFAIIPIIYTIAEDALSTVPDHLRSASLGAGATPWQTALRIVIPTAMSGLFSATMIGMGRGVGETMIVLMAAGNTPILDLNIFNGFRPLPANIAVELPEAVRDSTHYRILFLSALVLFAMTFVLNTAAELVRQRFRKRAYQL